MCRPVAVPDHSYGDLRHPAPGADGHIGPATAGAGGTHSRLRASRRTCPARRRTQEGLPPIAGCRDGSRGGRGDTGVAAVDARSRDRRLASQDGSLRACSRRTARDGQRIGEGHVYHPGPSEGPGSHGRVRRPHSPRRRHPGSGRGRADVVMIDQEHGPIGPESLHAMVRPPLAPPAPVGPGSRLRRGLRESRPGRRCRRNRLPAGDHGRSAAECVALTRYPPKGAAAGGHLSPTPGGVWTCLTTWASEATKRSARC